MVDFFQFVIMVDFCQSCHHGWFFDFWLKVDFSLSSWLIFWKVVIMVDFLFFVIMVDFLKIFVIMVDFLLCTPFMFSLLIQFKKWKLASFYYVLSSWLIFLNFLSSWLIFFLIFFFRFSVHSNQIPIVPLLFFSSCHHGWSFFLVPMSGNWEWVLWSTQFHKKQKKENKNEKRE